MKHLIFIGIIVLCFLNITSGIHLRHESIEQRKTKQDDVNKAITQLEGNGNYTDFVLKLQNYLEKGESAELKFSASEFRKGLITYLSGDKKWNLKDYTKEENKINAVTLTGFEKDLWQSNLSAELGLKGSLGAIPVTDLQPTQKEIGLQNSLDWAITQEDANQYFDGDSKTIGAPIVTYKGKYVIDGHHRWSQLYMLNPKAKITAYNIESIDDNPNAKPEYVLKKLQMIIGAYFGIIPKADVKAAVDVYEDVDESKKVYINKFVKNYLNCRFLQKKEFCDFLVQNNKEKPLEAGKDYKKANSNFIKSYIKLAGITVKGNNDIEEVMKKIENNIKEFVQKPCHDKNSKPSRFLMPQTDGPENLEGTSILSDAEKEIIVTEKQKKVNENDKDTFHVLKSIDEAAKKILTQQRKGEIKEGNPNYGKYKEYTLPSILRHIINPTLLNEKNIPANQN